MDQRHSVLESNLREIVFDHVTLTDLAVKVSIELIKRSV